MKLTNLLEYRNVGAGTAIEKLAKNGDPTAFGFMPVMTHFAHCDFSFSGIKSQANRSIMKEEIKHGR